MQKTKWLEFNKEIIKDIKYCDLIMYYTGKCTLFYFGCCENGILYMYSDESDRYVEVKDTWTIGFPKYISIITFPEKR